MREIFLELGFGGKSIWVRDSRKIMCTVKQGSFDQFYGLTFFFSSSVSSLPSNRYGSNIVVIFLGHAHLSSLVRVGNRNLRIQ